VVAVDVAEQGGQAVEGGRVVDAAAVGVDALGRTAAEVGDRPLRRCDTDHRDVERSLLHHRVERGEDLLAREVARHPEEHERVGADAALEHLYALSPIVWSSFSSCPPNSLRIAESSLSAKSAAPRDVNRAYSAALRTSAGTPSS